MDYDLSVFIGRFQPFHLGHKQVIDEALAVSEKLLIMVGSSFEPRSPRNPWSYEERIEMLRLNFTEAENKRIICEPLMDIRYNDSLWLTQVQKAVYKITGDKEAKTTLIGHRANGQGYYTSQFPQWHSIAVDNVEGISGYDIRAHLFSGGAVEDKKDILGDKITPQLSAFMASEDGKYLIDEYQFVENYRKGWDASPFPPTHVTVDAVVIQSGHILLVERDARPGMGLWALPGGFIEHEERLLDAAIRKLKEKTKIKVPAPVLFGSVKEQAVFDAPFRSARGRTITHAFYIELRGEDSLPKVKGGTNTSKCQWLPLGQLDSSRMFDDHYFIVQKILGTM